MKCKVTGNSQHAFMKGKSCLTSLVTLMGQQWIVFISTSVRLLTLSTITFSNKMIKNELNKQTVRWTENQLHCWVQKVVVNSTNSSWRPVTLVYSRD